MAMQPMGFTHILLPLLLTCLWCCNVQGQTLAPPENRSLYQNGPLKLVNSDLFRDSAEEQRELAAQAEQHAAVCFNEQLRIGVKANQAWLNAQKAEQDFQQKWQTWSDARLKNENADQHLTAVAEEAFQAIKEWSQTKEAPRAVREVLRDKQLKDFIDQVRYAPDQKNPGFTPIRPIGNGETQRLRREIVIDKNTLTGHVRTGQLLVMAHELMHAVKFEVLRNFVAKQERNEKPVKQLQLAVNLWLEDKREGKGDRKHYFREEIDVQKMAMDAIRNKLGRVCTSLTLWHHAYLHNNRMMRESAKEMQQPIPKKRNSPRYRDDRVRFESNKLQNAFLWMRIAVDYLRGKNRQSESTKFRSERRDSAYKATSDSKPVFGGIVLGNRLARSPGLPERVWVQESNGNSTLCFSFSLDVSDQVVRYGPVPTDHLLVALSIVNPSEQWSDQFGVDDSDCNLLGCEIDISTGTAHFAIHPALVDNRVGAIAQKVDLLDVSLFGHNLVDASVQWMDEEAVVNLESDQLMVTSSTEPKEILVRPSFWSSESESIYRLIDKGLDAGLAKEMRSQQLREIFRLGVDEDYAPRILTNEIVNDWKQSYLLSHLQQDQRRSLPKDMETVRQAFRSSQDYKELNEFAKTLAVVNWLADHNLLSEIKLESKEPRHTPTPLELPYATEQLIVSANNSETVDELPTIRRYKIEIQGRAVGTMIQKRTNVTYRSEGCVEWTQESKIDFLGIQKLDNYTVIYTKSSGRPVRCSKNYSDSTGREFTFCTEQQNDEWIVRINDEGRKIERKSKGLPADFAAFDQRWRTLESLEVDSRSLPGPVSYQYCHQSPMVCITEKLNFQEWVILPELSDSKRFLKASVEKSSNVQSDANLERENIWIDSAGTVVRMEFAVQHSPISTLNAKILKSEFLRLEKHPYFQYSVEFSNLAKRDSDKEGVAPMVIAFSLERQEASELEKVISWYQLPRKIHRIPVDTPILFSNKLRKLELAVNKPSGVSMLSRFPNQRSVLSSEGASLFEIESPAAIPAINEDELSFYSMSTPFVKAFSSATNRFLEESRRRPNTEPEVRRLVYDSLENSYRRSDRWLNSDQVIELREGDCKHFAILYAALARTVGFPARIVTGLVYDEMDQSFVGHAWNEVCLNGSWKAVDATRPWDNVGANYIKLQHFSDPFFSDRDSALTAVSDLELEVVRANFDDSRTRPEALKRLTFDHQPMLEKSTGIYDEKLNRAGAVQLIPELSQEIISVVMDKMQYESETKHELQLPIAAASVKIFVPNLVFDATCSEEARLVAALEQLSAIVIPSITKQYEQEYGVSAATYVQWSWSAQRLCIARMMQTDQTILSELLDQFESLSTTLKINCESKEQFVRMFQELEDSNASAPLSSAADLQGAFNKMLQDVAKNAEI